MPKHYAAFNAGTRLLFLYPEFLIVSESDIQDLPAFIHSLWDEPFLVRIATDRGSGRGCVRQLFLKVCDAAMAAPIACSDFVLRYLKG